jgi:hypothetical protein
LAEPAENPTIEAMLPAGSRFQQYSVVRLVGSGGMGAVFEAVHVKLNKRVALKILHPSFAANAEVQARFLQEGAAASRIAHPFVVDVTDFGVHDGVPFLVMEYLEGESLADRITRDPQLSVRQVADLMIPVCAAVSAAHAEGVIHRDLKPENVFLARLRHGEVQPRVVDFGVAKVIDTGGDAQRKLTLTNGIVGSPMYMAPESIRSSSDVDARSDQYALGVMLYELSTGRRPFEDESLYEIMDRIVRGTFVPPRALRPELPDAFEQLIVRAMSRAPDERFGSVRQLGRELLPFASERIRALCVEMFTNSGAAPSLRPTATAAAAALDGTAPRTGAAAVTASASTLADSVQEIPRAAPSGAPARTPPSAWVAAVAICGAVIATAVWTVRRPPPPTAVRRTAAATAPAAAFRARLVARPTHALLELDGHPVGRGSMDRTLPRDGAEHTLRISAPGYEPLAVAFRDAPPPEQVELRAVPTPPSAPVPSADAAAIAAEEPAPGPAVGRERPRHGAHARPSTRPTADGHATAPPAGTGPANVGTNGAAILE